jgi:hypothetical protein
MSRNKRIRLAGQVNPLMVFDCFIIAHELIRGLMQMETDPSEPDR